MAKTKKEVLISIKSQIDSLINNPLLNPDFSTVGEPESVVTEQLSSMSKELEDILIDRYTGDDVLNMLDKIEHEYIDHLIAQHEGPSDEEIRDGIESGKYKVTKLDI